MVMLGAKCLTCGREGRKSTITAHVRAKHLKFCESRTYCLVCRIGFWSKKMIRQHALTPTHTRTNKLGLPDELALVMDNADVVEISTTRDASMTRAHMLIYDHADSTAWYKNQPPKHQKMVFSESDQMDSEESEEGGEESEGKEESEEGGEESEGKEENEEGGEEREEKEEGEEESRKEKRENEQRKLKVESERKEKERLDSEKRENEQRKRKVESERKEKERLTM
jgi:hypothetical protein